MSRHSSLAVTTVDRTADYFAKPEVRMAPDFAPRHRRGMELQEELRLRWIGRAQETSDTEIQA